MPKPSSRNCYFDGKTPGNNVFALSPGAKVLDIVQLAEMEQAFRKWAKDSPRQDIRRSRQRILLIFLLIRHTGARLHEILNLKSDDIIFEDRVVRLGSTRSGSFRSVEIPDDLVKDLRSFIKKYKFIKDESLFLIDPGHVRRKFYERAEACGLPRDFGNPSTLRRSKSVELLRANLPLPAIEKLLGHTRSSSTSTLLDFSDDDIHFMLRRHMDLERDRRTSARNVFFGKIIKIIKGDIQSEIVLLTLGGIGISSIITNGSLEKMRLRQGSLVTAEIKAPAVFIAAPDAEGHTTSAENRVQGTVTAINSGRVNSEVILTLKEGTELCAIITTASLKRMSLQTGDKGWALFGAYSVILNIPQF
jgi:molybdate transport system regulatory protein